MVLGFKRQFEAPIRAGTKTHSIRIDAKNRWKAGTKIHIATGVRTKQFNCFSVEKCTHVQEIEISCLNRLIIKVDGKKLRDRAIDEICFNDGLTRYEFANWFCPTRKETFSGKIIHWTELKY